MGRGCVELSRIMCSRGRLGRRRDVYHCLALSTMRTFLLPYRPGEVVKLTMGPGGEKGRNLENGSSTSDSESLIRSVQVPSYIHIVQYLDTKHKLQIGRILIIRKQAQGFEGEGERKIK